MNVGSLFSGIGGLDLGFERAGFRIAWMCEKDQFCRRVLAHHWPGIPIYEDVHDVSAESVSGVDVLIGGFPCQPFSVAGKRRGHEDERYLWPEAMRLVRELRPYWCCFENVPGIRAIGADRVCEDMEEAGYSVWPLVVGADDCGAPHRRKRVFFVAYRDGIRCGGERLAEPAGLERSSGDELDRCGPPLAHPESRGLGERGSAPDERHGRDADGSRQMEHAPIPRLERLREGLPRPSSHMDDTDVPRSGDTGKADSRIGLDRSRKPDRRTAWPSGPGQPQHEWEPPRCVTRLESGLGDLPDGLPWRLAPFARRNALRALGNSVVPQVAEAIGRAILSIQKTNSPALERRA